MNLSIAIPDSSLLDEATILYKTKKISIIARACAIFSVNQIFIYQDGKQNKSDSMLLSTSLKYLETPQYFRKQIFPKTQLLKYAGILQPLNISSHLTTSNQKMIKIGDMREALIILDAKKIAESNEPILIVFGTTNKGIHDILGTDIKKIQNAKTFNFFPNQATQTVRLEEAILGILSIINIHMYNYIE